MKRRAIFLDRDGVINHVILKAGKPYSPKTVDQVRIYSDVEESLEKLKKLKFEIIIVTNQPEISRGNLTINEVSKIHDYITSKVGELNFFVCPHDDQNNCSCRKPKPGLLLNASTELDVEVKKSFMIGDRWRDIEAGNNAGCLESFFINRHYREKLPSNPYTEVRSLKEAVNMILEKCG